MMTKRPGLVDSAEGKARQKKHNWEMSVRHRGAQLYMWLRRALEALDDATLSDADRRGLLIKLASAHAEFLWDRRPRISDDVARRVYRADGIPQGGYPVIDLARNALNPVRRSSLRRRRFAASRYEYRDRSASRQIEAGTAWLAVLLVLAKRSGVVQLKYRQVHWDFAGDTCARGRFQGKQVTASLVQ